MSNDSGLQLHVTSLPLRLEENEQSFDVLFVFLVSVDDYSARHLRNPIGAHKVSHVLARC